MPIVPNLPATMPARTQPQAEFDDNMAQYFAKLPAIGASMDEAVNQVNIGAATATAKAAEATTKAEEALASVANAQAAQAASEAAANATAWVSGSAYAVGDVRYSPVNYRSYRRKTAGAGATDPASDTANWAPLSETPEVVRDSRTASALINAVDRGQLIDITSGTFTQPFAATATLGNGWFCYVRNSGTGIITLDPSGAETIDGLASFAMSPGETRMIQCDGAAFNSVLVGGVNFQEFLASGTWNKPPGATWVYYEVVNGGNSGKADSSSGTAATEVAAGSGGARVEGMVRASTLGATVSVVVGSGGVSAVATTTAVNGNTGGVSSFNSISPLATPTFSTVDANAFSGSTGSTSCHKGGAGGGVITGGVAVAPGVSKTDGNGGAGVRITSAGPAVASPGVVPGGGGGAASALYNNTSTSGAGANGRVRVWAW